MLVIPQLVAVFVLSIAASIAVFIAFFAVLFTGRWPEGLRVFVVDVSRYWLRVDAYSLLVTDEYPSFALH